MKKKQNFIASLEKAVIVGLLATSITGAVFGGRYIDKKQHQKNCELYGHLQGQPENLQRDHIEANLAKNSVSYKRGHILACSGYMIDMTVNGILEDVNKCQ